MTRSKFVRTQEEIERIQRVLAAGRFTTDGIEVEFETTPEFVHEVLPPCLSPTDEPVGVINVSKWEGEMCGEFGCGIIWVKARYEGLEGLYCLLMIVSGDMPVTLGREVWGECKKTGTVDVHHDDRRMYGYTDRMGTRLIEIEAEFGDDQGATKASDTLFEVKAQIDASGIGLQHDPILVVLESDCFFSTVRQGTAEVELTGSKWDPVDSIPIVSIGPATHAMGEANYRAVDQFPQTDRDAYLPYVLGRSYDDVTEYRVPQRHRAKALAG